MVFMIPDCSQCDNPKGERVSLPMNGKVQAVDACIHQIIAALQAGGVHVKSSDCGHGDRFPNIQLEDGRVLAVLPDLHAIDWRRNDPWRRIGPFKFAIMTAEALQRAHERYDISLYDPFSLDTLLERLKADGIHAKRITNHRIMIDAESDLLRADSAGDQAEGEYRKYGLEGIPLEGAVLNRALDWSQVTADYPDYMRDVTSWLNQIGARTWQDSEGRWFVDKAAGLQTDTTGTRRPPDDGQDTGCADKRDGQDSRCVQREETPA